MSALRARRLFDSDQQDQLPPRRGKHWEEFDTVISANQNSVPMATGEKYHSEDLYIVFNFLEDCHPQPPPLNEQSSQDGYWRVVQAMKQHDQYLEGMLLRCLGPKPKFPYAHYVVFNTSAKGRFMEYPDWNRAISEGYGPQKIKYQAGYRELYTFTDPTLPILPKRTYNPNAGYIISIFKTVGDLPSLDQRWNIWSGADFIAGNIPAECQLKRLTVHKTTNVANEQNTFTYVLMCELGQAMTYKCRTLDFVERLRDRYCGHTALYVIDHLF